MPEAEHWHPWLGGTGWSGAERGGAGRSSSPCGAHCTGSQPRLVRLGRAAPPGLPSGLTRVARNLPCHTTESPVDTLTMTPYHRHRHHYTTTLQDVVSVAVCNHGERVWQGGGVATVEGGRKTTVRSCPPPRGHFQSIRLSLPTKRDLCPSAAEVTLSSTLTGQQLLPPVPSTRHPPQHP